MYNLEQGTYSVSVSSTDETVVNSYTVESQSSLSLERTETVEVDSTDSDIVSDVEFSGNTSALVEVKSSGTVVYDERLDATDVSSTEWQTVTYSPATTGNFTVDISAEDLSAVNQTAVEMDSGAVGGIVGRDDSSRPGGVQISTER